MPRVIFFMVALSIGAIASHCGVAEPAPAAAVDFDSAVRLYVKGELEEALKVLEDIERSGRAGKRENDLMKVVRYDLGVEEPQKENRSRGIQASEVAEALCEVGFSYAADGDFDRAEELFLQAEAKAEGFLPACVALAELYRDKGDVQRSLEKWLQAKSMAHENAAISLGFAVACARAGEMEKAEENLRSLVSDPDIGVRAQVELGRILWERQRQSEAKAVWEAAISRAPRDGSVYYVIAECCRRSGDLVGTRIGYRKALDLGYMPDVCERKLASLKR